MQEERCEENAIFHYNKIVAEASIPANYGPTFSHGDAAKAKEPTTEAATMFAEQLSMIDAARQREDKTRKETEEVRKLEEERHRSVEEDRRATMAKFKEVSSRKMVFSSVPTWEAFPKPDASMEFAKTLATMKEVRVENCKARTSEAEVRMLEEENRKMVEEERIDGFTAAKISLLRLMGRERRGTTAFALYICLWISTAGAYLLP